MFFAIKGGYASAIDALRSSVTRRGIEAMAKPFQVVARHHVTARVSGEVEEKSVIVREMC